MPSHSAALRPRSRRATPTSALTRWADELVYFRGHITAEPEDGVYVFEDGTGNVRVEIPNEARTGVTLRRDVRYEVFGRALRLPFEELRVQAETLTPISGK